LMSMAHAEFGHLCLKNWTGCPDPPIALDMEIQGNQNLCFACLVPPSQTPFWGGRGN
jgi:hypothetical protein